MREKQPLNVLNLNTHAHCPLVDHLTGYSASKIHTNYNHLVFASVCVCAVYNIRHFA